MKMARKRVPQLTEKAMMYRGPPLYMYDAYMDDAFETALIAARAAARLAGGRGIVFEIQARTMTKAL